jgi:VanZ family protein
MRRKLIFFLTYWLPVIALAGIIFKLSSGTVPKASEVYWQDFAAKKFAHFMIFGLMAVLIYRAVKAGGASTKNSLITAFLLTVFYGATDEFHQYFTQGREARLRDVGFDSLGAIVFLLFIQKILPKMPKEFTGIAKRFEII